MCDSQAVVLVMKAWQTCWVFLNLDASRKSWQSTTISCWIKPYESENVSFAVITDRSSTKGSQAVLIKGDRDDDLLKRYFLKKIMLIVSNIWLLPSVFFLLRLTNGAAVRLTGRPVSSPGNWQSCELVDQSDVGEVVVLGECDPEVSPPSLISLFNRLNHQSLN